MLNRSSLLRVAASKRGGHRLWCMGRPTPSMRQGCLLLRSGARLTGSLYMQQVPVKGTLSVGLSDAQCAADATTHPLSHSHPKLLRQTTLLSELSGGIGQSGHTRTRAGGPALLVLRGGKARGSQHGRPIQEDRGWRDAAGGGAQGARPRRQGPPRSHSWWQARGTRAGITQDPGLMRTLSTSVPLHHQLRRARARTRLTQDSGHPRPSTPRQG